MSNVVQQDELVGQRPLAEATFADWAKLPGHVQVRRHCDTNEMPDLFTAGINVAMTPEEVALRVEEAMLMGSLPVC